MSRTLAFSVAALSLVPLAVAATVPLGEPLLVDRVAMEGAMSAAGPLAAFDVVGSREGAATLLLEGRQISATSDFAKYHASAGLRVQRDNGTSIHSEEGRAVSQAVFEPGYRLFVTGLPGAEPPSVLLRAGAGQVEAASQDEAAAFDIAHVRPPQRVDVGDTLQVGRLAGDVQVQVAGSFRLVLWRIDLTLQEADGSIPLQSGEWQAAMAPVPGSEFVAAQEEVRQLFLDVHAGHLTLAVPAENLDQMFLGTLESVVAGSLLLERAGIDPHSASGTYQCDIARAGERLEVKVTSSDQPAALTLPTPEPSGAERHSVGAPIAPGPVRPPLAWTLGALALAGAGLALLPRILHRWRFRRLERAFEAHLDREVVEQADGLRASPRHRWSAGAMKVLALSRQGDDAGAMEALAWLEGLPEANPEGLDYLVACIAVGRGEQEVASALLKPLLSGGAKPDPVGPARMRTRKSGAPEGYA